MVRAISRISWGCLLSLAACGSGVPDSDASSGAPEDASHDPSVDGAARTSDDAAGALREDAAGAAIATGAADAGAGDSRAPSEGGAASSKEGGADASRAPTGPYAWSNVAIGGGGFVSGLVFSPVESGLVYLRTDVGGFYRRDSAAGPWIPLTDGFPMAQGNYLGGESIAPDPVDANVVYAAAGMYLASGSGIILRSTDRGVTWTTHDIGVAMGGNASGRGMGERLAVDPANPAVLLFGSRDDGLYRSIDSGGTWAAVAAFPTRGDSTYGLPVVVFDGRGATASGSRTIYVGAASKSAGSNLYRSADGGATWALVSGGPTGLIARHASLGADGTLWLAYGNDYGPSNVTGVTLAGQVWKLSGDVWTNVTPPAAVWGGQSGGISADAENPDHAIVSTLDWYAPDRLLATQDGGATWTVIAQPPVSWNPTASTYDVQGAAYWLSSGTPIGTGATNWVEAVALDPFSSAHALYGTGSGVWEASAISATVAANGQGITWSFLDQGLEETVPLFLVPAVHGAFLGAIGDLGGMRNTTLTSYAATGEYGDPIFSNTNALDFAEADPNTVVRVGSSGGLASDVALSQDNGQTWTPCAAAPPGYTTVNEMQSVAVAADGSRFLVSPASGHGSAAFTTDGCAHWTASSGLPSGAFVAADRVQPATFYATSGGTLYVSGDGGASFASAGTFSGSGTPRPVFGLAGEVWIAASGGSLYRFTASGATREVISAVSSAYGVGFGRAATGQARPALYVIGVVAGQYGFFRSDDGLGETFVRINDDAHQFGWLQNDYIAGDEDVFGRVYLTTSGRGYVYGDPM